MVFTLWMSDRRCETGPHFIQQGTREIECTPLNCLHRDPVDIAIGLGETSILFSDSHRYWQLSAPFSEIKSYMIITRNHIAANTGVC